MLFPSPEQLKLLSTKYIVISNKEKKTIEEIKENLDPRNLIPNKIL